MVREILVHWTSAGSPGGTSVLYFGESVAVGVQRAALDTLLDTIVSEACDNLTSYTIATEGKILNAATGGLQGIWNDATAYTGTGGVAGEPVANATQVLLQWRTAGIRNNRLVKGHTFIPGASTLLLVNGQVNPSTITGWAADLATFVAGGDMVVWSRPRPASAGEAFNVVQGSVWPELAVLRQRRA